MLRVTSVRFRGVVTIVRRAVENMLQVLRFQGCDMHSHYKGIRPKDVMCICGQIGVGAGGGGKGGAQIQVNRFNKDSKTYTQMIMQVKNIQELQKSKILM